MFRRLKRLSKKAGPKKSLVISMGMHKTPESLTIARLDEVVEDFLAQGTGYAIQKHWGTSARIEVVRGLALELLMESGAEGVLFVDDDMWPPIRRASNGTPGFNPLLRLMSHDKEVIGAGYVKRQWTDCVPVMSMSDENGMPKNLQDENLFGLTNAEPFRCDYIGMGFTWVSRRAILRMADTLGTDFKKYFEPESAIFHNPECLKKLREVLQKGYTPDEIIELMKASLRTSDWMKEDFAFCKRAVECGVEIWIDPSFDVAHLGTYAYTRQDWLVRRLKTPPKE